MVFLRYFIDVFRKNGPHKPGSFNLRMMHGINRISIIMFGIAILVVLFRLFSRTFGH